jgi:nucleoside recognition membrane protein YjiH
MQNAVFGFYVDLDEIRDHNYNPTKKKLKKKMCTFFFNMFCDLILLIWVNFMIPSGKVTAALYLTEKVWLILWTSAQFTCYFIAFFASWFAVCKPQVLLNARWNRVIGQSYMFFLWT